jgi:hypothetical protein
MKHSYINELSNIEKPESLFDFMKIREILQKSGLHPNLFAIKLPKIAIEKMEKEFQIVAHSKEKIEQTEKKINVLGFDIIPKEKWEDIYPPIEIINTTLNDIIFNTEKYEKKK